MDVEEVTLDEALICPDCRVSILVLKHSKYGNFYGCASYHETGCKGSVSADERGNPKGIPAPAATRALRKEVILLLERFVTRLNQGTIYPYIERPNSLIGKTIGTLGFEDAVATVRELRGLLGEWTLADRIRED